MHTRHTQHAGPLSVDAIPHKSVHVRKTVPAEHPLGVAVRGNNSMSEAQTAEEEPLVVSMAPAVCLHDSLFTTAFSTLRFGSCKAHSASSSRL
jgi:hypothetical protein